MGGDGAGCRRWGGRVCREGKDDQLEVTLESHNDNCLYQARVIIAEVVTSGQILDILKATQNPERLGMRCEKKKSR